MTRCAVSVRGGGPARPDNSGSVSVAFARSDGVSGFAGGVAGISAEYPRLQYIQSPGSGIDGVNLSSGETTTPSSCD